MKWGANKAQHGFTLIELLIVLAILTIVFSVVFIALNPLELFSQSRNAKRWVNTSELLDAIHLYIVQNDGDIPNESSWQADTTYMIGTANSGCSSNCNATSTASACLDLSPLVQDERIGSIPFDPKDGTNERTGLYIRRSSGSIITIGVCNNELDEVIELLR